MSTRIKELQNDLKTLGYDPGPIDGIVGPRTKAALAAYARDNNRLSTDPDLADCIATDADKKTAISTNLIIPVQGDINNLKNKARDFTKPLYLQIHQTDYWPGERCAGMKTNFYVSTKAVYEVHSIDKIVEDNYSDFVHIEVAWVSESRKTVVEKGKTYHREAGAWTPEREALLETAIVYAIEQLRAKGAEPTIITHRQTYKFRVIDPDTEIAQAAYRITAKHGFKLDFDLVRGSGKSAALWYPAGCAALAGR